MWISSPKSHSANSNVQNISQNPLYNVSPLPWPILIIPLSMTPRNQYPKSMKALKKENKKICQKRKKKTQSEDEDLASKFDYMIHFSWKRGLSCNFMTKWFVNWSCEQFHVWISSRSRAKSWVRAPLDQGRQCDSRWAPN